jgi:hypothetical protein
MTLGKMMLLKMTLVSLPIVRMTVDKTKCHALLTLHNVILLGITRRNVTWPIANLQNDS